MERMHDYNIYYFNCITGTVNHTGNIGLLTDRWIHIGDFKSDEPLDAVLLVTESKWVIHSYGRVHLRYPMNAIEIAERTEYIKHKTAREVKEKLLSKVS